jgi:uncharacterized protein
MPVSHLKWLHATSPKVSHLKVKATPNSSKNTICGLYSDEAVKIRIAAPPSEGMANKALVEFLAKTFSLPKTHVVLLKGGTSPIKTFELQCSVEEILRILDFSKKDSV